MWWRTRDSLSNMSQKDGLLAKPRSFSNLPAFLDLNGTKTCKNGLEITTNNPNPTYTFLGTTDFHEFENSKLGKLRLRNR